MASPNASRQQQDSEMSKSSGLFMHSFFLKSCNKLQPKLLLLTKQARCRHVQGKNYNPKKALGAVCTWNVACAQVYIQSRFDACHVYLFSYSVFLFWQWNSFYLWSFGGMFVAKFGLSEKVCKEIVFLFKRFLIWSLGNIVDRDFCQCQHFLHFNDIFIGRRKRS